MSQLQKANSILVELSGNVSTSDRKAAISEGILSEPHLIRYLKGNGTDLDIAMSLVRFFRKKIEDRERELLGAS